MTRNLANQETLPPMPRTRSASVPLRQLLNGSATAKMAKDTIANGYTTMSPSPITRTVILSEVEQTTRSLLLEPALRHKFTRSRLKAWILLLLSLPSSLRMPEHAPQEPSSVALTQRNSQETRKNRKTLKNQSQTGERDRRLNSKAYLQL